jgi:hypothetical protein
MIWALQNWRLIAAGLAVVGLLGAAWYIDSRAYNRGYEARKREYDTALQQLREKQLFELSKMEKGYDSASQKVRSIPSGCVGPAMHYSHDWLRKHRIDRK